MSAQTALGRGRIATENLMVDACVLKHKTGSVTDDTTGVVTPTYSTLYTGKCRVQQSALGAASSPASPGEAYIRLLAVEVQVPMSVVGAAEGDQFTITASPLDADLVGRVFRVQSLAHKTHATARRIQCIEVTS